MAASDTAKHIPRAGRVPWNRIDAVIEALMAVLLLFLPLALGGVYAWSEQVAFVLIGIMILLFVVKWLGQTHQKIVWTAALVPVAAMILLAAFQLAPLPSLVISLLSPATVELKAEFLADLDRKLEYVTLSFYPFATADSLGLLLMTAAIFVLVLNVYQTQRQIKRLLGIISVIGALAALLALAQCLWGNGRIYWLIPVWGETARSGPFVNHSHYGQFMNLCLGAALGLLFVLYYETRTTRTGARLRSVLKKKFHQDRRVGLLAGMMCLGVMTIFLSLSRGGMISLLIAGTIIILILARKLHLKWPGWLMVLILAVAGASVMYCGFEVVYERWAALRQGNQLQSRLDLIRDLWPLCEKFPLLGTGLGSHEVVYALYGSRAVSPTVAVFAENEYVQTLVETGWLGISIVAAFVGLIWYFFYRCVRRISIPVRAAALGLGFGLLAVQIHSLSDYGQHIPANACLSAVYCGLMIRLFFMGHRSRKTGQAAAEKEPSAAPVQNAKRNISPAGMLKILLASIHSFRRALTTVRPVSIPLQVRAAVVILILGGWGCLLVRADVARRAEARWQNVLALEKQLRRQNWHSEKGQIDTLIAQAQKAIALEPDNLDYQYWSCVYEWEYLKNRRQAGSVDPEFDRKVWAIVERLNRLRRRCPVYGPACCLSGQLQHYVLNEPSGPENIRRGYRLAPYHPTAVFAAGLLDAEQGRLSESLDKFRHYLRLGGQFNEVVNVYLQQMDRPEMAISLALNDPGRLIHLSKILRRTGSHQALVPTVLDMACRQLEKTCREPDVSAGTLALLAQAYYLNQKYEDAEVYLRQALDRDYGRVEWRLTLADILARTGQAADALDQARICLRLKPGWQDAQRFLNNIRTAAQPVSAK